MMSFVMGSDGGRNRLRPDRRRRSLISVALAGVVAAGASVAGVDLAGASEGSRIEPQTNPVVMSAPIRSGTIEGSFRDAVALPESGSILALTFGEIVEFEIDFVPTAMGAELSHRVVNRAVVPTSLERLRLSPDEEWVFGLGRDSTEYIDEVHRIRVSDLSIESQLDLAASGSPSTAFRTDPIPDSDGAVIVTSNQRSVVYDRDGPRPSTAQLSKIALSVDDPTRGYSISLDGLFSFSIDETGISSPVRLADHAGGQGELLERDGFLVHGPVAYSLADFTSRPSTLFQRAHPDPSLPYRYFRETADGAGPDIPGRIFDERTGAAVIQESLCVPDIRPPFTRLGWATRRSLLGDGLSVGVTQAGVTIGNIPKRCGRSGEFVPLEASRLLDTRTGAGTGGRVGPVGARETVRIDPRGQVGIPEIGVSGVVLNVTAVRQSDAPGGRSYFTAYPSGTDRPVVSTVNVENGAITGNMATLDLGADGGIDIYHDAGSSHLVVDVLGYFTNDVAPPAARLAFADPVRVLDTRSDDRPLGPNGRVTVSADEIAREENARGVVGLLANVTAVRPTQESFLQIFSTGAAVPEGASMNFPAGANTNRLVTLRSDGAASFEIINANGETHITVDVVGFYVEESRGQRFTAVRPFRALDTRSGSSGRLGPDEYLRSQLPSVPLPGSRTVHYVANVAAAQGERIGFLSTEPETSFIIPKNTSVLNFAPGVPIGNQTVLRSRSDGPISIYASESTHVIVDVFGYYS